MAGADADEALGAERSDPEPTDLAALRVTREESRAVLDHQVELSKGIIDRTIWTVRTAGVALGLLVSIVGSIGPTAVLDGGTIALVTALLGVCSMLGCIFVGLGTYSVSQMHFGVDDSFRSEVLAGGYDERAWLRDLLAAYDGWSGEMRRTNQRIGGYLLAAQLLLIVGVTFLVAAIALTVMMGYL